MKQEKDLFLKDLCARVPYHPKGHVVNACNGAECDEWLTCATVPMFTSITNNCRLYLRPMSSMTEEEKKIQKDYIYHFSGNSLPDYEGVFVFEDEVHEYIDWLNAHHFDYRNLIERELAIDCTGLHIYD